MAGNKKEHQHRILVIDDDKDICALLTSALATEGFEVEVAHTAEQGLEFLDSKSPFDLVMLDIRLPDAHGTEVLAHIFSRNAAIPVIMVSAYATVDLAVKAVKEGAFDFIQKPFDLNEMFIRVRNAINSSSLSREISTLRQQLADRYSFDNIVGKSRAMQDVFRLLHDIAVSDATVLITGESGTGKELVARALHVNSPRANKPFVVVNSAAIPETLLESELFGHEKGSFTGAVARKIGKFEAAEGGSIFLDEIGDLSPTLQVKILRVLQEKEFERVGGLEKINVNVRVIAATNRDLQRAVREKNFREDLYYRLNVLQVELPPLRERYDDIPMLAMYFLEKYAKCMKKHITSISPEAMGLLQNQPWRGNVRELENAIERAVVMSRGQSLEKEDFPLQQDLASSEGIDRIKRIQDSDATPTVGELEKEALKIAIKKCRGNITAAAKQLGIGRDTMYRKMRKYKIAHRKISQ